LEHSDNLYRGDNERKPAYREENISDINTASLYIHIPFCKSLCDYCDFFSVPVKILNDDYIDLFINSLIKDINNQINFFNIKNIPTVYIGGGTPSVLGNKIKKLSRALNKIPGFSPIEFTIEANPESITREFLLILREEGVNRLSLGVQTFNEMSREAVNRTGDVSILEERLSLAMEFFKDNLSIDLMTGLPYQDKKIVLDDINRVLSSDVSHISLYSLTVENGSPLIDKIKKKKIYLPRRDLSDSLWLTCQSALVEAGFDHYEVSNFALNGKRCLHNIRYWKTLNWIGAGPSASGTIFDDKSASAARYTYPGDTDLYIKSINNEEPLKLFNGNINLNKEIINADTLLRESLLMGYRCKEGPDKELFKKRFGITIEECIPRTLEKWKRQDKFLFLNGFLRDAFSELDELII